MSERSLRVLRTGALLVIVASVCFGQAAALGEHSFEDLNLLAGAATMPRISDSVLGTDSEFRRTLFRHGILIRAVALPRVSMNLLDGPVAASDQVYIGQRPTWITGLNPIITADLRQLRLHDAQLNIGAGWRWTTWNPAGPKTLAVSTFYLYKAWAKKRVEMKVGYITNDQEFVGLQVGGSLATGAQGVYAVLPYQVGMSYFPMTAPEVILRLRGPHGMYVKSGVQRSLDPAGGLSNEHRNQTGFRFAAKGESALFINEVGYQRASGATANQLWVRAGYLHNRSEYVNKVTLQKETGNECSYLLADYQLSRPDGQNVGHGLFVGGTVMAAPAQFNSYDRYYEARLYQKAPLRSRPDDVLSFVAAFRGHSRYVTERLEAQGKTTWHSSPSLTGSYSIHVMAGNYFTVGLSAVRGAAITPRVADSVTFTANWGVYF